jgi:hypothetical protein
MAAEIPILVYALLYQKLSQKPIEEFLENYFILFSKMKTFDKIESENS